MSDTFLEDRIAAAKARVLLYEDALLQFSTTGIQSYTIDTGQTRQTVTRADISSLEKTLTALLDNIVTMTARCTGSGSYTGQPGW